MPQNLELEVKKLSIDLRNFRTVPQKNEIDAIKAMIAISRDRFYAVLESILDEGYTPTENIIILKEVKKLVVKEGNRRIACLKIILGHYPITHFTIPAYLVSRIATLDSSFKKENEAVPCIVFDTSEAVKADKIVSLTHGKGEKASRQGWSSVAKARHNRDVNGAPEPALDMLEKYLGVGNNLTNQQRERWAGEYPLTVLYEAIRVLHVRAGYKSILDYVHAYPKISNLAGVEELLRDIGLEFLQFKNIRDPQIDFAVNYGFVPIVPSSSPPSSSAASVPGPSSSSIPNSNPILPQNASLVPLPSTAPSTASTPHTAQAPSLPRAPQAYAINDPRSVKAILKKFAPTGTRSKVVTLRNEMHDLNIKKNPIAFCFLLRSIFEISAKNYCVDNGISTVRVNGGKSYDFTLQETLKAAYNHLTNSGTNTAIVKNLHGAYTELSKTNGILSVTSLNRLVHDPTFSIIPSDICIVFGNVYPLLEYMN